MSDTSSTCNSPTLLSPWRRRIQWIVTSLVLLTPWLRIGDESLLRIDIPGQTLFFIGQVLRIEELYLILLFSLTLTLWFLLVTTLLGRVWCGWLCPQTTLTDLAEWLTRRLGLASRKTSPTARLARKLVLHVCSLLLAFLVSANLLWYFISPPDFFAGLVSGQLHYATWTCLLLVTLALYLDLILVRRLMCSEFCPYGRFQTVLADQATLTLHLPPAELDRCIRCNSCVRVCPMKIDIRDGYQVECINCGRCLDACREVMAKRNQPGLISYTFGTEELGSKALLNLRTLLLSLVTITLASVMVFAIVQRPTASLKIAVSHTAPSRALQDGKRATFFNAWVNNRGSTPSTYHIEARQAGTNEPLDLKGRTRQLEVSAGENLRIDFVLVTPVPKPRLDVEFILVDQFGSDIALSEAYIKE